MQNPILNIFNTRKHDYRYHQTKNVGSVLKERF